jgi:hypothetical protein
MTTEQAVKAIESHIMYYFNLEDVPNPLLTNIKRIINSFKVQKITVREVLMPDRKKAAPDLQAEWLKICEIHLLDPKIAKKGRYKERIAAKAHFVRHIIMNYEYITLTQIAKFFGNDHTTIIHLRDHSSVPCPIPPLYQKKRFIINQ